MGEEYNLPSGLAGCEYYNELTGESECRIPGTARVRNKALIEALQQLHKLQRQNKNLARELTQVLRDYNPLQAMFKTQTAELETMAQHLNEAWSELEQLREAEAYFKNGMAELQDYIDKMGPQHDELKAQVEQLQIAAALADRAVRSKGA